MATRGIKIRDGERLDKATILMVSSKLNAEKPITKKEACDLLNISYNVTRLNRIIEEFNEKEEYAKLRRKQNRTMPITISDKADIVNGKLEGETLTDLSDRTFRSIAVIKNILSMYNIPHKENVGTYHNPELLPDSAISNDYEPGDLVWSACYSCPAVIKTAGQENKNGIMVYRIWLYGKYNQYANQPYYELGDLRKAQKELGLSIRNYSADEIQTLIIEALNKARKLDK
jgi:hypothetical protein